MVPKGLGKALDYLGRDSKVYKDRGNEWALDGYTLICPDEQAEPEQTK